MIILPEQTVRNTYLPISVQIPASSFNHQDRTIETAIIIRIGSCKLSNTSITRQMPVLLSYHHSYPYLRLKGEVLIGKIYA